MRVKYIITDELQEEVKSLLRQTRDSVVKERLVAVSLYVSNHMTMQNIAVALGRNSDTIGRWISKYFENGIESITDNRGGDNKSFLSNKEKDTLKHIITTTYPITYKGWDGWIIVDLIKTKFGVTYTRGGVYALLKSLGITHKIATKIDPKKSEEKIATWKIDTKKFS